MSVPIRHVVLSRMAKLAILFYLLGLLANVTYKYFGNVPAERYVMGSDMEGYYQYLPHVFIKDIESIKKMHWAGMYENGNTLSFFTCGVAIMEAPFFLIAHGASYYFDLDTSGYAPVYFTSVFFAALFYVLIGLIFLYKALLRYFERKYAFWTTALVFYATNLFYYTIISPGMSHAYSFSLICAFIYFVPVFYDRPTVKNTLKLIFPLALAVLIRPTNLLVGLYFVLFDISSFKQLGDRLLFYAKKWYLFVIMVIATLVVFTPQMLYWHYVTGKYIIYSYQNSGFTNLLSPYIATVLIGARNGLFIYTPLMFVATIGLLYLAYKKKMSAIGIVLIMIIIVYLDASWCVPTFSGAAGYRALIEFYPLLALPLAFVVQHVMAGNRKYLKIGFETLLIFFVVYNVLFTYKYSNWLWWNTDWHWSYLLRLIKF